MLVKYTVSEFLSAKGSFSSIDFIVKFDTEIGLGHIEGGTSHDLES